MSLATDAQPAPTERLGLDAGAERGVAAGRALAAVVVGASAVALLTEAQGPVLGTLGGLGVLAALGWISAVRRAGRRLSQAEEYYLELGPDGLLLAEPRRQVYVPWTDVAAIEVEEERLDVLVHRRSGAPLRLEPRYRGLGSESLRHLLEDRWRAQGLQ